MACQRCNSTRIMKIVATGDDRNCFALEGQEWEYGYLPYDIGLSGGSSVKMNYCLECGQIQGEFPLPLTNLEGADDGEEC